MQCACAVLHFRLWPVWLYHIFLHYLTNATIFRKRVIEHEMCVSILSTNLSDLDARRIERDATNVAGWLVFTYGTARCHKCSWLAGLHVRHRLLLLFCQILMRRVLFYRQVFERNSNIKLHENLSCGSRVVPCGRTDGQA
jgi:hypothetical protein